MNIAIITGGSGLERNVSLNSAKNIQENIDFANTKLFVYPEEYVDFLLEKGKFDLVIPIIHGDDGEDGVLQEKLENLFVPHLFSSPKVHKKCFNKIQTKDIIRSLGISTPSELSFSQISENDIPFIVKPKENGSSFRITLIENKEQLENLTYDEEYMYEDFVDGREFTVGVIEQKGEDIALPIMEIKKEKKIFDYDDGYLWAEDNDIYDFNDCQYEFGTSDAEDGCNNYIKDNHTGYNTFYRYGCTEDCSGHEAGYSWAEDNDIDDTYDCGGNSQSFIEGCEAYVEENY